MLMTKSEQIEQLNRELENASKDLPIVRGPKDIVPGEGNAEAELLFIGEAAGRNEAIQRRPFDRRGARKEAYRDLAEGQRRS